MFLRLGFVFVVATLCLGTTRANFEEDDNHSPRAVVRESQVTVDPKLQIHRPVVRPGQHPRPLVLIPENYPQTPHTSRHQRDLTQTAEDLALRLPRSISQSSFPRPGPRPQPSPTFPRPPRPTRFRREPQDDLTEDLDSRLPRSISQSSFSRPGPRPQPSPTFPRPPRPTRFRREPQDDLTEDLDSRLPRSISQSSFPRPGPRPQPSPTFPRPPRPTRFRREVDHAVLRSPQPFQPRPHFPPQPSPTFPRPEDIFGPVLTRVRRGGGRVSVDVDKSRGSKSTTRVTAEHNVYKSGDGRTRVDAGAYATNRGDRGGSINFSHRF